MSTATELSSQHENFSQNERFFRYFQHEITAIQDRMARLNDTALIGGERQDATDHCLAAIARLSNEVKDASSYLPTYDQRTYGEAIKALQERLAETRAAFGPKQRFAFKTARKNPSAVSLSDAAELAAQRRPRLPGYLSPDSSTRESSLSTTPNHLRTPNNEMSPGQQPVLAATFSMNRDKSSHSQNGPLPEANHPELQPETLRQNGDEPQIYSTPTNASISNQRSTHAILPTSSSHAASPCILTRIEKSVLDVSVPTSTGAPFAALTARDIKSSLLLCGRVDGPAHVTSVQDSVMVVECRQFRMHECRNVDVYLTCSSRPIIEDCSGIRFAPLPRTYAHTNQDQVSSQDLWDQVDDFKWLKQEHSPNWRLVPSEDIVLEDVWREIVPGGPGWSLDDILKATKVLS